MARSFDGASQYLWFSGAPITAVPVSLAAWFTTSSNSASQEILSISRNPNTLGVRVAWRLLAMGNVAGDPIAAYSCDSVGNWSGAVTTSGYSVGAVHHACAVFAANNDRRVYIDGGSKGTEATSRVPGNTPNIISIAARVIDAVSNYLAGMAAESAIWNIALSDEEVAVLATGVSPALVRPQNLVAYWPIIGRCSPEIDIVGGYWLTLVGAPPVADHPRIFYPHGGGGAWVAVPASFMAAWAEYSNSQVGVR